ncbi:hypothetical protein [Novosphingobium album (ex Hu et al. 2023)]|uniref:Uncharacterized protein n=1 Tax=Novosphingobium album (ex Hu et al. 2023) TaxID=2930093 RepID=A0ABT0B5X9_9SPHN|nr:hypothetical protein [Novosphingobium album (ex Hu et al. 2023)]MCJ2180437.1 hypothetical protein [Novosphingobium album (ex Hu et al. 2023)]
MKIAKPRRRVGLARRAIIALLAIGWNVTPGILITAVAGVFALILSLSRRFPVSIIVLLVLYATTAVAWTISGYPAGRVLFLAIQVLCIIKMGELREGNVRWALICHFIVVTLLYFSGFGGDVGNNSSGTEENLGFVSLASLTYFFLFNSNSLVSRAQTSIFSFLSVLFDGRRYIFLNAQLFAIIGRRVTRYPFALGAIVSIGFPIMSIIVTLIAGPYSSLYARYRQIDFLEKSILREPGILLVGNQPFHLELPLFFWVGDTKFIGSIFEFGLVFFTINLLLTFWMVNQMKLTSFQKFLLGQMCFGYLGANPIEICTIFLISRIK